MLLTTYLLMLIFVVPTIGMGALIACGKGDGLIAGYNTARPQQKEKINIRRLRLVTAVFLWTICGLCLLFPLAVHSKTFTNVLLAAVVPLTIFFLILANTWCKKK